MTPRFSPVAALILSVSAVLLTSCRKPEVRVYLAPRDATPPSAAQTAQAPAQAKQPERAKPAITYTVPPGWTETTPGQVSVAAFEAKGDGVSASVSVAPLPDMRGREALVVNMYRQQTGQPPIEEADLGKTLQRVPVADGEGQLLELAGSAAGKPTRLIAVFAHRDGRSWFYRISGDDAFVATQKQAFLDFLKSVRIAESPASAEPAAAEAKPEP